jgi:hypothetical protein
VHNGVKDTLVIEIKIKAKHGDMTFMCTCHAKTGKYGNEAIKAYFHGQKNFQQYHCLFFSVLVLFTQVNMMFVMFF